MQGKSVVTHIDTGVIYPPLQNKPKTFLLQTISFHDAANETFYHGLILGLCALLDHCNS